MPHSLDLLPRNRAIHSIQPVHFLPQSPRLSSLALNNPPKRRENASFVSALHSPPLPQAVFTALVSALDMLKLHNHVRVAKLDLLDLLNPSYRVEYPNTHPPRASQLSSS